jgi:hypothetical protein
MSVEDQAIEQPTEVATEVVQQPEKAEETAQSQEPQQADATEGEPERDEKGRFKGVQPRIDELTRKRHEAEREAAYWRGVATQGKAQPSAEPAAPAKPTPDQFDDHNAYVEALTDWKVTDRLSKELSARDAKQAEMQQATQREATWAERQAAARTAMPDYDQVVGASDAPIADHVAQALKDSEHGPALAYHLAKHPEVLDRLNGMDTRSADREIGRIEARLTPAAEAQAIPVKTTQAPKPASINGSQGRSTTPNLQTASMDEYMRQRKAQGARWAR